MASSEATETKCIIKGLLISNPLRCTVKQLCNDFLNTVGYKIPFQRLGFKTIEEYLHSIPDTVRIHGSGSLAEVEPVINEKSAHINELVARQKNTTIPKHKRGQIKRFHQFSRQSTSGYNRYYSESPTLRKTNNNYSNISQSASCSYNFSESSSSQSWDNEYCNEITKSPSRSSYSSKEKDEGSTKSEDIGRDGQSDISSDNDEYQTKVPPRIQNNLGKLIKTFPEGILCTKLPSEYHKMFGKKLSYAKCNYRSLIEMCSDLPEIFQYVQNGQDEFILYDRHKHIPSFIYNDIAAGHSTDSERVGNHVLSEVPQLDWSAALSLIPGDVLHLSDKIPRYFPVKDVNIGDYLDISVGEIYDISKFWVYMTFSELHSLMRELQTFFKTQRNKYLIPEILLEEGLYCTTLYAGEYHRSVIVNLLPALPGFVRVLFIDYGTIGNVHSKEIWYLPTQFAKIPCQAIRARLSNICPVYENRTWSIDAVNRFKELITNVPLVGEVTRIDEDDHALEIYLADITDENKIFFINDKLVDEGHAAYNGQVKT